VAFVDESAATTLEFSAFGDRLKNDSIMRCCSAITFSIASSFAFCARNDSSSALTRSVTSDFDSSLRDSAELDFSGAFAAIAAAARASEGPLVWAMIEIPVISTNTPAVMKSATIRADVRLERHMSSPPLVLSRSIRAWSKTKNRQPVLPGNVDQETQTLTASN
jgi:hypothetical protein